MNIVALLPFIVLIGAMFLMTRSAKNKQRAASSMRQDMQPGTGVRTIGGLYARVKEITDDTVVVEIAPGVHATFAKNAIGAVLEDAEYDRIVNGIEPPLDDDDLPVVPDSPEGLEGIDLTKPGSDSHAAAGDGDPEAAEPEDDAGDEPEDAVEAESEHADAEADEDGPAAK